MPPRRPDLPTLSFSTIQPIMSEDVHTPLPGTPISIEQGPLMMTPDIPAVELGAMLTRRKRSLEDDASSTTESLDFEHEKWTDDEDGLLQGFLIHPPHPLNIAYPPSALPPPAALDKITSQVIESQSRKDLPSSASSPKSFWHHTWRSTRQRLFLIARQESMSAIGGHRRQKSDSVIPAVKKEETAKLKEGKRSLNDLKGGRVGRHQNDSMDSLFGNEQPGELSETLRLSSCLQSNAARDEGPSASSVSTSFNSLFSNDTFERSLSPFGSANAPARHMSLLQRGRSFTFADFEHEQALGNTAQDSLEFDNEDAASSSPWRMSGPDLHRSISSPVSALLSSLPTSISSRTSDCDTPTATMQSFGPALGLGTSSGSKCSTPTVPTFSISTPPISFTSSAPTTDVSPNAFASLSISPLDNSDTSVLGVQSSPSGSSTLKRTFYTRPSPLPRSLSDGAFLSKFDSFASLSSTRENKRQRAELLSPTLESVDNAGCRVKSVGAGHLGRGRLQNVIMRSSSDDQHGFGEVFEGLQPPFETKRLL
ncbi:hypothetical protein I305_02283 [Cryptococcus gattii E566]|uniref:Uncharacterized protein n=2 Tax=Cryptococcus gattii TaxID=37769 RepID=E6RDR2_CRYGW|nr:Hypothetical protein CGB_K3140W [Cryptococcus gattii WM276]ADV24960.1 Hypothetical protein CGB_K3140W [Cryptococcus gattii WM276]KIR79112.1 hypothetical protein I306_03865 [Cryptococcus gattii EJB2]KIY35376.1 hypothetical protein I305_02283 [Cryptococcus gattii E566]